jgi:hypothetical protein
MIEGSNASALLGLHAMVMTGIEVADEVTITIETTADRVGCRSCGVIAALHDRRLQAEQLDRWALGRAAHPLKRPGIRGGSIP